MKEAGNNLSASLISGCLKDMNGGMTVVASEYDAAPLQVRTFGFLILSQMINYPRGLRDWD